MRQEAEQAPRRGAGLRPDRAAPVQPDVRDDDRAGAGVGLQGLPATRDGAGHLHQLQERAAAGAAQTALRHRPDRQVVPQRDHARQLPLPHARVRADGAGVLRAAGRSRSSWYRYWLEERMELVPPLRPAQTATCACASTQKRSSPTTRAAPPTSSTCSRLAGRSWRGSPTAATTTSAVTPSSRAPSWSTSARTASVTSRT